MVPQEELMKIYFAGSIRAGRDDVSIYETMITWLQAYGEVLTEHVGNPALPEAGDDPLKGHADPTTGISMNGTWHGLNPVISWWPK